jgi:hypothetical protein
MDGAMQNSPRGDATHVRITLRYIEILDSKDFDTTGEFRFRFRAGVLERGDLTETRIPEDPKAHLAISEHPAMNRLTFNQVLFQGDVGPDEALVVEAGGEEIDRVSRNDPLTPYRRIFEPPVVEAFGDKGPWDEGTSEAKDPEQLGDWRFAYTIEEAEPAAAAPDPAADPADGTTPRGD